MWCRCVLWKDDASSQSPYRKTSLQQISEKGTIQGYIAEPSSHFIDTIAQHFQTNQNYLVSDPTSATRTGDVVRITEAGKVSKHIRHRVTEIVTPWGPPITERPAVLSQEEIIAMKQAKRKRKEERKQEKKAKLSAYMTEGSKQARDTTTQFSRPTEGRETKDDHVEGVVEGTQVAS